VEVHLPPDAEIALETGYGGITVSGTSGITAAKTGAGDVNVPDAARVTLHSGAGNVSVGRIGGGTLRTGAGDIGIERSSGDTELNSGSGDVTVLDAVGTLRIHTGAGDVNASLSEGTIEVRSGMGDIIVRVPTGIAVWQELTTGMGDVRSRITPLGEPEPGEPYLSVHSAQRRRRRDAGPLRAARQAGVGFATKSTPASLRCAGLMGAGAPVSGS